MKQQMNARPQVRELLIGKKIRHWLVIAKHPAVYPHCATWRARKNYLRLCAKYPETMQRLSLNELSEFDSPSRGFVQQIVFIPLTKNPRLLRKLWQLFRPNQY
jgi:hypothetical protein